MVESTFKGFIQQLRENGNRINVKYVWLLWRNLNTEEIWTILRTKRQQVATDKLIRKLRTGSFK